MVTKKEKKVLKHLAKAWNKFLKLPIQHDDDIDEFRHGIHNLQRLLAIREARRHDDYWTIHVSEGIRFCGFLEKKEEIHYESHLSEEKIETENILADKIAEIIGDLFIDSRNETPVEQWRKVVSALRHHGIKIVIQKGGQ